MRVSIQELIPAVSRNPNVLLFPGFVLLKVQKDNNTFNNIVDVGRTRIVLLHFWQNLGCGVRIFFGTFSRASSSGTIQYIRPELQQQNTLHHECGNE